MIYMFAWDMIVLLLLTRRVKVVAGYPLEAFYSL